MTWVFLKELERLLINIKPPVPVIFRSNHASNALALAGNLPKDQDRLIKQVQGAIAGEKCHSSAFHARAVKLTISLKFL